MSNKVTIRGCFSVAGKKSWKVREGWNFGMSAERSGKGLVMKGVDVPSTITQVGNLIEIDLERNAYDKYNSFWLERTDEPYTDSMKKNEWTNMLREASCVFDGLAESPEEAAGNEEETDRRIKEAESEEQARSIEEEAGMLIMDPPTVTLDKSRKLEFIIYLRGEESSKNFLMLAEQNIVFDRANKNNFCIEFVVHKCGFVTTSLAEGGEEEELEEELEEKLGKYVMGYDGEKESALNDFLKFTNQIPEEAFETIPVEYSVSEHCEFNSWDEEP